MGAPAPRAAGRSPRSSGSCAASCRRAARRRRCAGCARRPSRPVVRRARSSAHALAIAAERAGGSSSPAPSRPGIIASSTTASSHGSIRSASAVTLAWLGRSRQTHGAEQRRRRRAPTARRACCAMNGASFAAREALARARRRSRRASLCGTAEVTIASTNAIDSTAPVFCSSVRAPAAMPRRCAGTAPIIAAVFGLLNMPEPTPTSASQRRALPVGRVRPASVVIAGEAGGGDEHAERGERARAVAVGVDAGERRGDQHAERERDQLDAGCRSASCPARPGSRRRTGTSARSARAR